MTPLLTLLAIGGIGAAGSAWGLGRGGRAAQAGAIVGVLALLAVLGLALMLHVPPVAAPDVVPGTGILHDRLVPNDYLRLVVALWALDSILIIGVAWLADGLAGLRGLLPATLAAVVGGAVAFAATDLTLGSGAAGATGLAAMIVVLAVGRPYGVVAAARELRASLLGAVLLIVAAAAAPVAGSLALRDAAASGSAGEAGAVVGLLALAVGLAIALRTGAIPFHLRVPRLTDIAPPLALPLLLAWIPMPVAVVGLTIADRYLAPLALPLAGDQGILVAAALLTLLAAALAAFIQDDLRHATGYLVIADGALVLLGLAALDPAAWGPARTWLLVLAGSKTALVAWAAVMEERFETRSIPDLRGWLRRAPIMGAAFVVLAVATYGLPGWVAFGARGDLARLAAGAPWDALLLLAGFATLPTYLRWLGLGAGPPTSKVSRAEPERIVRGWRPEALPVEQERALPTAAAAPPRDPEAEAAGRPRPTGAGRAAGAARAVASFGRRAVLFGGRAGGALRRDRIELTAAAVLALAVLAALTSWGALDIATAAREPAPIVSGPSSD